VNWWPLVAELRGRDDELRAISERLPPEVPRPLGRLLSASLLVEDEAHAARLRQHYLQLMPAMREEQLRAPLFHTPLPWDELPHLSAGIDALFALLAEAGLPARVLGCDSPAALRDSAPTLHALYPRTHYGALMPLLYGYPADLRHLDRAPGTLTARIDRFLAGPILHELLHFEREREAIFPGYLDECLTGWLTVRIAPGFAYRADGEGPVFAAHWFAQVGLAFERAVGIVSLLRAHVGAAPWTEVLPPGLTERLAERGWADLRANKWLHFLSDNFAPQPWLALILDGARSESPLDERIAAEALRAMCMRNTVVDHHHVVIAEPPGAVTVDLDEGVCHRPARAGDPAPPWHWLPRRKGIRTVEIRSLDQIDGLAKSLLL
jgi:hypothetical protein